MATAHLATVSATSVTLTLDTEEAGYLLDLLTSHVAGHLTLDEAPLGRVREALEVSGVAVKRAHNANEMTDEGDYTRPYAVLIR